MTTADFLPKADGAARQVNIAGDNHSPVHLADQQYVVHVGGDTQLQIGACSAVSITMPADAKRSRYFHESLALVSVEAPFGRLPEAVVGRDDVVTAIMDRTSDRPPRIEVLSGMGGVGKTTVALSIAEHAKCAGADVYWVPAGSAAAVSDGMRQVALSVGVPADQVTHAWEGGGRPAADLVWRHLKSLDRPWILVFDDADELDVLSCEGAALADATGWARSPVGRSQGVLVTTRDRNSRSWGTRIARIHRLGVLKLQFAATVLQTLAPMTAGDTRAAEALADRLGCLPLALHLAGTYLAQAQDDPLADAHTFEKYADRLTDSPLLLDDAAEGIRGDLRSAEDRARATIADTWNLSLDLLERQDIAHARVLLQLLSCFAPATPLPHALVDPKAIAALPMWADPVTHRTVWMTIRGLHRFGLVDVDGSADEPVHQIHRLVAEVSLAPMLAAPSNYRRVWDSAADLLAEVTPYEENPRGPSTWRAWQGLIPHWRVMINRAPDWGSGSESRFDAVLLCTSIAVSYLHFRGEYTAACTLADTALGRSETAHADLTIVSNVRRHRAVAVMSRGDLKLAEAEFDDIVDNCVTHLGAAHPMTVSVRYDRARVLTMRGKNKQAKEEYDEVIRQETALYGADAVTTLLTRHDRAICVRSTGRFQEAADEGELVLAGLQAALGESHPDVLQAQHEYAVSLRDRGNFEEAAAAFVRVLEAEREILGINHPSTLITRVNLALTLMLCKNIDAGEADLRAVVDIRSEILGSDHHDTLEARGALAMILVQKGELDAQSAEMEFSELTARIRTQFIDDHPTVLASRGSHAAALRLLGERIDAEVQCRTVLDAAKSRHGEDHPTTLGANFDWAVALGDLGRTTEAIAEMRTVLARFEAVPGTSYRMITSARHTLGSFLLDQGQLVEAEEIFRAALDELPECSDRHDDIQHDLAAVLLARGQFQDAINRLRVIVEERRRASGPTHPDTLTVRNNLGIALKEFGELEQAATVYRAALHDSASNHSNDQPLTLTLRHNLAVVLRIQGRLDEAHDELVQILKIQLRKSGPEHPETLATRKSLARVLDDKGAATEAEAEYRDIRAMCSRVRGENHPHTLYVQGNLAYFLLAQGRFREAETEYRDALKRCLKHLAPDHPETLRMKHNLAMALAQQGGLPEAITRFQDVVERRQRTLGANHSETLTARTNLGHALYRLNQPAESAEQFRLVADGTAATHGPDHDSVWDARARRAQHLWEAGQPRQAQREFEALLSDTSGARQLDDPRVLAAERVLEFVRADADWTDDV
ncbi:tetratricopeptide (TPR) repeat protein [Nocardia transvalensis]|uniref:Tetratricopeptide (TPR) repeat protein n=1 Tax=Nocardia transvalensis TaxID=37333 RepID=A0A7W9P8C2_9NOCA|nr:tetratricopeptide repeat protein [Nocardia transvalensis]MBB5911262.1 tetratricopeptide (TPR) repeat protein [Nocardia transvalensis]